VSGFSFSLPLFEKQRFRRFKNDEGHQEEKVEIGEIGV
jgi:hypothetical protein